MKIITGKELYEIAMKKAKHWNHGIVPNIGIRESFLANEILDENVIGVILKQDNKKEVK